MGWNPRAVILYASAYLGYDNQHGYHHRHYFGAVEPVKFTSFEDIETQFQTDWISLRSAP